MSNNTSPYNNNQNGNIIGNMNKGKSDGFTDNGAIGQYGNGQTGSQSTSKLDYQANE